MSTKDLLSGSNSHGLSETTGGLGVLTTDLEVPVVAETTVGTRSHENVFSYAKPTASSSDG